MKAEGFSVSQVFTILTAMFSIRILTDRDSLYLQMYSVLPACKIEFEDWAEFKNSVKQIFVLLDNTQTISPSS